MDAEFMAEKINDRKSAKQLMERQRRARINSSLNQIKELVLLGLSKDPNSFEKLEKADILEMTVCYLKSVSCQQGLSIVDDEGSRHCDCSFASSLSFLSPFVAPSPANANTCTNTNANTNANTVCSKYRTGYMECLEAVRKYIEFSCPSLARDAKWRLQRHLDLRCFQSMSAQCCDCFQCDFQPANKFKIDEEQEHHKGVGAALIELSPISSSSASLNSSEMSARNSIDQLVDSSNLSSTLPSIASAFLNNEAAAVDAQLAPSSVWRPW